MAGRYFEWNPITIKRWRRFRRLRRAWYSFWILLALYTVSLGAELVCNNEPLLVRFEGRSFFPVFRFYPESTFLRNGKSTRPDYKQLAASPAFAAPSSNLMLFAPIPFGPNEIINPETLAVSESVTLDFRPRLRLGTLNLRPDLTIARSAGAAGFFDLDENALQDLPLTNLWPLTAELQAAIALRFRNEPAPSCSSSLLRATGSVLRAEGALSEFTPRATPPPTVRLTLRELADEEKTAGSIEVGAAGHIVTSHFRPWKTLDEATRSNVLALAARCLAEPVDRQTITAGGTPYEVTFEKTEVHWPYKPVPGHWLGVDNAGRDVLTRVVYGLRTSMTFGFLLVGLSMALGTLLGALQGYCGGKVDMTGQRFTEIWSALPFLYVMILLGAVYGRGFVLLLVCYAVFNWIGISYYIRAEFLRLRRLPFVEAAKAMGLPHRKIVFRHILPNALVPIITFFPFYLVGAIGSLAALDYLGFGIPPPTASWGELLQQAQQFRWAWWLILYPSLALFTVMLLGVFVGEGVRDAYDPRPQIRIE
jgi:microcin C transport system permease protein